MSDPTVGVYVHVPFCERVCPYCDFAVVAARRLAPDAEQRYVDAVLRELELRFEAGDYAGRRLASLYLGGGTPSLLQPDSVGRIVESVCSRFEAQAGMAPEITLEVNPSTLERERLPRFRDVGIGRLSIGIQSFDDVVLHRLGRAHRAVESHATLRAARDAGFANVSVDLIFAAPGGSLAQLERDLDALVEYEPQHVSTYELTIEQGTPFALAAERGQIAAAEEDQTVQSLERIEARLSETGMLRYEISSHAKPGFESRHNQRYWRREPVLGLGMGAWSSFPASAVAPHGGRSSNLRSISVYLERVEAGSLPTEHLEALSAATARGEALFLALRHVEGLDASAFRAEFGAEPRTFFFDELEALCAAELVIESAAGDLRLSARGRLLADSAAEQFL